MKVYEIIDWKYEAKSVGLWTTAARAIEVGREMVARGELTTPFWDVVEREVQE